MKRYITLSYTIKYENINLLHHVIREVCVILQVPMAKRPKYAQGILKQLHIFDTSSADPVL